MEKRVLEYDEFLAENVRLRDELLYCNRRLHNQKREITNIQEALRHKNVALDAMLWVWCGVMVDVSPEYHGFTRIQ